MPFQMQIKLSDQVNNKVNAVSSITFEVLGDLEESFQLKLKANG